MQIYMLLQYIYIYILKVISGRALLNVFSNTITAAKYNLIILRNNGRIKFIRFDGHQTIVCYLTYTHVQQPEPCFLTPIEHNYIRKHSN